MSVRLMAGKRKSKQVLLIEKIVSGGQTGVDRAALDTAIELGIAHGGWCPRGRLAEDGPIPLYYDLEELGSSDYAVRTEQNVIDSDATLILYIGKLSGGTLLTYRLAQNHRKPLQAVRLDRLYNTESIRQWLLLEGIRTLNVAGPRASTSPDIYQAACTYLRELFSAP